MDIRSDRTATPENHHDGVVVEIDRFDRWRNSAAATVDPTLVCWSPRVVEEPAA